MVLSDRLRDLTAKIGKNGSLTCVVYGETGTGKEEIAKLIHESRCFNLKRRVPFEAVNCSALDESIANSLLFGHKKGSFTGADRTTTGHIGEANGGILFLDEIHHLHMACQKKLLRVLNDGTYQRFGDTKFFRSDFQLVVASTVDLDDLVEEGKFLLDLRGRIMGVDIELPPLRDRLDDLPDLVKLFFRKNNYSVNQNNLNLIVEKCSQYYWQGNIRQLFKVLNAVGTMATLDSEAISIDYFPEFKTMFPPNSVGSSKDNEIQSILKPLNTDFDFKEAVENYEKAILKRANRRHKSASELVQALGMSRGSYDNKKIKYDLLPPAKT